MFFSDYRLHKGAKVRQSLLWEFDSERINWNEMRSVVVQRVIERGRINDFYAILNLYGLTGVKEAILQLPYLNTKDVAFVCTVFKLKKQDLKCYKKQLLTPQYWNS